jgi:hypothetical protein
MGRRCFRARVLYVGVICGTAAAAGQVTNRDTPGIWDANRDSAGCAVRNRDTGFATFIRNRLGVCCINSEPLIFPFGGAVAPP